MLTSRHRPNKGLSGLFHDEVLIRSGIPTIPIAAHMFSTEIGANMHIPETVITVVSASTTDGLVRNLTLVHLSVSENVVSTDNSVTTLSEIVVFLDFNARAVDESVSREFPRGIVTFPNAFIIGKYRRVGPPRLVLNEWDDAQLSRITRTTRITTIFRITRIMHIGLLII